MLVFAEEGNPEKNPWSRDENQQQTQPIHDTRLESNPVVRRTLSPLYHPYSSRLMCEAHTTYNHKSQTISWSNALRRALILYNISDFLFTCQEFSVVSAVKNSAYHNLVIFSQKLRVERTGNVKLLSYLPGGLFDLKDKQVEIVVKTSSNQRL